MAQQQGETQMRVLEAQIKDLDAKAMANEGLGYERASRIAENNALAVERIAAAQKDRDLGTLDRVRAVKELTTMDLDHVQRAVDILKSIQGDQEKEENAKSRPSGNPKRSTRATKKPVRQVSTK